MSNTKQSVPTKTTINLNNNILKRFPPIIRRQIIYKDKIDTVQVVNPKSDEDNLSDSDAKSSDSDSSSTSDSSHTSDEDNSDDSLFQDEQEDSVLSGMFSRYFKHKKDNDFIDESDSDDD